MLDRRRKQLLYRARYRGFREADLVIGGFADAMVAAMSTADLDAFESILSRSDHDIYAWVMGEEPPADVSAALIERMRAYRARRA